MASFFLDDPPIFVLTAATVVPFAAVLALVPFRSHLPIENVALGLVVVVMAIAVLGGRRAGVIAAITTALAFDLLLTEPFNSLRITASRDVVTTVLLAAIGLTAGELVERARRSARAEARARSTLDAVRQHTVRAAEAKSPAGVVDLVERELVDLLDLESCHFIDGPLPTPMPSLTSRSILVPGDSSPGSRGLMAVPVPVRDAMRGHLVMVFRPLTNGATITAVQRQIALALAEQLGLALGPTPPRRWPT